MAKGYDPDKYVNDLTKTAEGIADTVKKIAEKIEKAEEVSKTKAAAAKTAADRVNDLKADRLKVEDNGRKVANLIATAKGEPLPFPPVEAEADENQEALPV